jgi:hypothetical protein
MKDTAWAIVIGAVYIAIVMMLVRPSSKGPAIINTIFAALSDLVKGSTGYQP